MLQSIKDKIGQLLDKNQSGFKEDDFMRLKAYIDLLFIMQIIVWRNVMNNWSGWSDWFGILAVAAIFGADKNIINFILKGDEAMDEKIAKIKGLILDKVTTKIEKEDLTIDE